MYPHLAANPSGTAFERGFELRRRRRQCGLSTIPITPCWAFQLHRKLPAPWLRVDTEANMVYNNSVYVPEKKAVSTSS